MGQTLSDPDFITARGPLIGIIGEDGELRPGIGDPVPYTMGQDLNEHYPTDGAQRTFYTICRVKAESKLAFLGAILPDVYETENVHTQELTMTAFGQTPAVKYWRNPLVRLAPERHPIHPAAYAVDAVVLGGDGHAAKTPANIPGTYDDNGNELTPETIFPGWLTFRNAYMGIGAITGQPTGRQIGEGYVRIGVTWKDLPYSVVPRDAVIGLDPNDIVANPVNSEIMRYCVFKPQPKGQNVGITGGQLFYVNDNGTILEKSAGVPALAPLESQTFTNPATTFSITWKMVPRVPFAAQAMHGYCNDANDIPFPSDQLKDKPDTGTLRYLGYELSDPYYTVSGAKVYDITYSIMYRPGGNTKPNRGWNSTWCGVVRDIRRIVFGVYEGGVIKDELSGNTITLPVTSTTDTGDQRLRRTTKSACVAPFGNLQNLFRLEGALVTV